MAKWFVCFTGWQASDDNNFKLNNSIIELEEQLIYEKQLTLRLNLLNEPPQSDVSADKFKEIFNTIS